MNDKQIAEFLKDAKAIAWDTCHKIYVLMDDEQVELMKECGYDPLIQTDEATPQQMLEILREWWDDSCGLRFISAINSVPAGQDPNKGFIGLIPQCEEWGA